MAMGFIHYNARIVIPVDLCVCLRPTGVPLVPIATINKSTGSIAAALEQSALHLFLAAEVPASIQTVS